MKLDGLACVLILSAISIATTSAQDEDFDPRIVIESRQSALRDIGAAFKAINDELRKSAPALSAVREHAGRIETLSKHQHRWFPEGTGQDADVINAAKDEIWERLAEFEAGQRAMSAAATKLVQVAAGTDAGAIKRQAQALGKTCKACHDEFREED